MNQVTRTRDALAVAVAGLPGDTHVTLGPSDMNSGRAMGDAFGSLSFIVRKTVGEASQRNEEVVDDLVVQVAQVLSTPEVLPHDVGVPRVLRCSGHMVYASGPAEPPRLGCEWTVLVS